MNNLALNALPQALALVNVFRMVHLPNSHVVVAASNGQTLAACDMSQKAREELSQSQANTQRFDEIIGNFGSTLKLKLAAAQIT